jgi:hypothetical protein
LFGQAQRDSYENSFEPINWRIASPGIGPATIRALSLIGEMIFETKASRQDPVKYNFAHGGKDAVPYPVARETYDNSISYLASAIEGAEVERQKRIRFLSMYTKTSSI